jgi:hypothetical protein
LQVGKFHSTDNFEGVLALILRPPAEAHRMTAAVCLANPSSAGALKHRPYTSKTKQKNECRQMAAFVLRLMSVLIWRD